MLIMVCYFKKICGINQAEDQVMWPDLLLRRTSALASFQEWSVVSAWLRIWAQPRNPCWARNSASASTCLCAFFSILAKFCVPSMWKRKKWIILCAFWNLNALKDLRHIVGLSLWAGFRSMNSALEGLQEYLTQPLGGIHRSESSPSRFFIIIVVYVSSHP